MTDFAALLDRLAERDVEVIVVGGVAAVLQGVPTTTFDLDVVPARDPENLRRLHAFLVDVEAVYREHLPKRLVPREAHLASPGHHLLQTRLGPVDVMGSVVGGRGYAELRAASRELDLGGGRSVRVLGLAELIAIKEQLGREKDRAVLPLLRRTLREEQA